MAHNAGSGNVVPGRSGRNGLCGVVLVGLLGVALPAAADSLTNPAPAASVRPLSTDRPDATESPYTVDAGHIQLEADAYWYSRREENGVKDEETRLGQVNIKVGVHDRADVQFVIAPYVKQIRWFGPFRTEDVGSDAITVRVKLNLTGNDGEGPGVALLPFVALPTASGPLGGGGPHAGVALPVALSLPRGFGLGLMAQAADRVRGNGYLGTASLSRTFEDVLGLFLEIAAERFVPSSEGDGFWSTTLNTGFTYALSPNLQLDGAAMFGLTDAAPDVTAYTGITVRH